MRLLLAVLSLAAALDAGTVRGVVLEHASGRALARSLVRLDPLPGSTPGVKPMATRAGRAGQFLFHSVAPGSYLLTAVRDGYFPASFGQRLPAGRGRPIEVTGDSSLFAEIRLRHKGVITGRVLDENGVGVPGVPVIAYRARLPLRQAASGVSDDRGFYRVYGLDPGKYWVRSAAHTFEDNTGWAPTFGPQSREVEHARIHNVTVDGEAAYADVSPEPGSLFYVRGEITCDRPGLINVVLASETMHRTMQTYCAASPGAYGFQGLPAGVYEIFAEAQGRPSFAYISFPLGGGMEGVNLSLQSAMPSEIEVHGAAAAKVKLTGRRQYLSAAAPLMQLVGPRMALAPGLWELRAELPPGYYVESISNIRGGGIRRSKAVSSDEWFEVFIEPRYPALIRVTVSDRAARIGGRVLSDGKPLAGAPVFLWPATEASRRSLGGAKETVSAQDGSYQFESLAPGEYRLLASFDVHEIDAELAEISRAATIQAAPGNAVALDVTLWTAPY